MLKDAAKQLLPGPVQSFIRSARLRWSMTGFKPRITTRKYGEKSLDVYLADPLSEEWYDHDWREPQEITFMKSRSLRDGAKVFDLGAHQGVVALMLAGAVGKSGQVIALEASPHNAAVAVRNVELNGAGNVVVLNAAIAAKTGTITFNKSLNGQIDDGSGAQGKIDVEARTIDDLAHEFGHPDVIYLDVEGFECEALLGAGETLEKGVDCFIEVHGGVGLEKFGGSVGRILSYFPDRRFSLYFAERADEPFLPFDRARALDGKRWFLIAAAKQSPAH